jgi:50S ribosomal protein L16 3-hydroxylase
MTLYRSVGDALEPDPPRSRIEIEFDLRQGAALVLHPWTRTAWRRHGRSKSTAHLYLAGQIHALPLTDARTLAAAERVDAEVWDALSESARALVLELLMQGHYRLDADAFEEDGDDDAQA